MKKIIFCFLSAIVLIVLSILFMGFKVEQKATQEAGNTQGTLAIRPFKSMIVIKAEGEILHYQKESFYNKEDFSEVIKSKMKFKSEAIESFNKKMERYNEQASNYEFKVNDKERSIILKCDVRSAMYSTNSYDFHWLLGDLPFDLYQFEQSDKELNYQGKINNIPTTIRLIFPYRLSHCHEHVWPTG